MKQLAKNYRTMKPCLHRSPQLLDNGATVDEGISCLKKAIDLKPDYDDAMAYLNLLYRQKADMEWNREDRDTDLKLADDLVDQVKKIKEKKMRAQLPQSE